MKKRIRFIGIEKGFEPERVLGVKKLKKSGKLKILIKWKHEPLCELIPNRLVRKKFPEMLLDFYEKNLSWDEE